MAGIRKHIPTLYAHPETNGEDLDDEPDDHEDDEDDTSGWMDTPKLHRQTSYQLQSASSRMPTRSPAAFVNGSGTAGSAPASSSSSATSMNMNGMNAMSSSQPSSSSRYSDIYSQFLRRYRSQPEYNDDARDEIDHQHPQWRVSHNTDGVERDEDDRPGSAQGSEPLESYVAHGLDGEALEPETAEDRERLEWQSMLASVLSGDVLKSEKSRIQVALDTSSSEANSHHLDIWMGIRAKFRGRKVEEERRLLDERRRRVVDPVISEILNFRVKDDSDAPAAVHQVNAVILRLDFVQSLYPNLKSFYLDKPITMSPEFQARRDTLITWSTVLTSLRQQINLLRKWTGSDTLDVNQPNTSSEKPIHAAVNGNDGNAMAHQERRDTSTFVERVLKEENIQRTFEKGSLTTIHALIASARDTQVNLAIQLKELNLPNFDDALVLLISFPTRLIQDCLRVRLDYATKVKDPDILIVDQMLEDFRLTIGFACTLKRQYESFCFPDPGGNWNPPNCISDDYDAVVLQGLNFFFRLINWKLKSAAKDMHFKKETDLLEAQWATFNDVSLTVMGGASAVAEQLSSLVHRLMIRVNQTFRRQLRFPIVAKQNAVFTPTRNAQSPNVNSIDFEFNDRLVEPPSRVRIMSSDQRLGYYGRLLDGAKVRHRKLQRYSRTLCQRFSNAAEYSLEDASLDPFIAGLIETDHFLVYTQTYEEEGTYIIASRSLRDRPDYIQRILRDAFHVNPLWEEDMMVMSEGETYSELPASGSDEPAYVLVLSPRIRFLWTGLVLMMPLPKIDLELKDNRVRLIADGPHFRLALARQRFADVFALEGEDGEAYMQPLVCLEEQVAHLPYVNRELKKITRAADRLAEGILESVHYVRKVMDGVTGFQELLESWYSFAADYGQHAQKYMEMPFWFKFSGMLIRLSISWVSLICDECDPTDRRTFRWAVSALEFALMQTKRSNILHLPSDQFELLRQKVASCMTLLMSHFDILGARSNLEAKKEKERQEELQTEQQLLTLSVEDQDDLLQSLNPDSEGVHVRNYYSDISSGDRSIKRFREDIMRALRMLDEKRAEQHVIGRVLDTEKPEDRSLQFLASYSSNFSIRWQQGVFIGAGAFGSVYTAVNLDTGSVMAVKEIRYQVTPGAASLFSQIQAELRVMEMLHHPNVVEYYGMEVHRDKIYIFEEYCECGSLAAILEMGRITDEHIVQVYTMQMLEGLHYLHSQGIVHRDIKPDNILLDHQGVLKFVDFGAAKVIAKNSRTIQRSRIGSTNNNNSNMPGAPAGLGNSLTGTPMYMSPEVIKNEKSGRQGAMDIWSMGCVVLECATGRKPWSNLDNEWAIMFHIGIATKHPPLPETEELSEQGINFIKQCLILDPLHRPTAKELMEHPWMVQFMETLRSYEEDELSGSPPTDLPPQEDYQGASVAYQAAVLQEKEVETINCISPGSSEGITPSSENVFPD